MERSLDRTLRVLTLATACLSLCAAQLVAAPAAGQAWWWQNDGEQPLSERGAGVEVTKADVPNVSAEAPDSLCGTVANSSPYDWQQLPGFDVPGSTSRWRTRVGAIILARGRPGSNDIVIDSTNGASVLNARNFVFPAGAGADIGVVRYGNWFDLDFRYFGVSNAPATVGPFVAPAGSALNVSGTQPSLGPATFSSHYDSTLQSIEINLRRRLGASRWAVLGGYRFISFRDPLFLMASDPSLQNGTLVQFGSTNNMLGWQLGVDGILWDNGGRFRIETIAKAGVYADAAHSSVIATSVGQGQGGGPANYMTRNQTSFVGDVNFTAVYQITPRWALRGGYQLLFLGDVATGGTQVNSLNFGGGMISTNTSHSAWFQGGLVGLEYYW